jgi:hypothetical protein
MGLFDNKINGQFRRIKVNFSSKYLLRIKLIKIFNSKYIKNRKKIDKKIKRLNKKNQNS